MTSAKSSLSKTESAFRTIGEVSKELKVPQHVLRFWETKFPQIQPVKGPGGRRYYRSEDVKLILQIKQLLYKDGFTIKGVQKILDENQLDFIDVSDMDEKITGIDTVKFTTGPKIDEAIKLLKNIQLKLEDLAK